MVKAVVFDLDGVYFENGTETFIQALIEKFGLTREDIAKVYFSSNQMQDYKKGEILGDEFWKFAIETWGIDSSMEKIISILLDSYSVKEVTKEYVDKLRSRGIKTAICTNNFPERLNGLEKIFDLNSHFDVIVSSFEEGVTKPSAEIFDSLSKKLECTPREIIMSDDREDNIKALKELGFQAIYYTTWESFVKQVEDIINNEKEA